MRFRTSWLARLLRGRRLDRNPLRRGTDRAETVVFGALLAGFLAAAPFAAHAAGAWAHASAAGVAVGGLAVVLATAGWLVRRSFDRRRLSGWDAGWLANGPRWSPRR